MSLTQLLNEVFSSDILGNRDYAKELLGTANYPFQYPSHEEDGFFNITRDRFLQRTLVQRMSQ